MGGARDDNYAHEPSEETQPVKMPHGRVSESLSPPPRIPDVRSIYMRGDQQCRYCGTHFTEVKDVARHWMEGHAMGELKKIEEGRLDMSRARIITTPARMSIPGRYKIYCPNQDAGTCGMALGSYVVRPGSLKRHLLQCPDGQGFTPSEEEVDAWMSENITLDSWHESARECKNRFEAAIWMIHTAS